MRVYNRDGDILDVYLEPHEAEKYGLDYIINNVDSPKARGFLESMLKDIEVQSGFFGSGEFTATFYKINGYGFKVSLKLKKRVRVAPRKRLAEARVYYSRDVENLLDLIYTLYLMRGMGEEVCGCALYYYNGVYYLAPSHPSRIIRHLAYEFRFKSAPLKDVCDVLNKSKLISRDAVGEIGRCL